MQIQRTNLYQSAAGSLLAALAKAESGDAPAFQQQFAETVEAIAPRTRSPRSRERANGPDPQGRRLKPQERPRSDPPERKPDAGPATQVAAARPSPEAPPADRPAASPDQATAPREKRIASASAPEGEAQMSVQAGTVMEEAPPAPAAEATAVGHALLDAMAVAGLDPRHTPQSPHEVVSVGRDLSAGALVNLDPGADAPAAEGPALHLRPAAPELNAPPVPVEDLEAALPPPAPVEDLEAAIPPPAPESAAAAVQAAAGEQQASAMPRAVRETAPRAAAQADDPANEPAPTEDAKTARADERQAPKQANYQQAIRNLNLHAQAVRADIVSIQVISAPPAESPDQPAAESPKLVDGPATPRAAIARFGRDLATRPAADQSQQIEHIVRVMRASISRGGSRVSLQLDPPDLGRLRIQMQIRGGELVARFETETESARLWIQNGLAQLRDSLASQGLRLVDVSVENRGPGAEGSGRQTGGAGGSAGGQQGGAGSFSGGAQPFNHESSSHQYSNAPAGSPHFQVGEPGEEQEKRLDVVA